MITHWRCKCSTLNLLSSVDCGTCNRKREEWIQALNRMLDELWEDVKKRPITHGKVQELLDEGDNK